MILPIDGHKPHIPAESFVAPSADVIGDVRLGERVSVWFGAVIRADIAPIVIGDGSKIQDGCVLHVDEDVPVKLGSGVTVGHGAVLHSCAVGGRDPRRHGGRRIIRRQSGAGLHRGRRGADPSGQGDPGRLSGAGKSGEGCPCADR